MCDLIVVTRPGYELAGKVPPGVASVVDLRGMSKQEVSELLGSNSRPGIFLTDAVMIDVSATRIRTTVQSGDWATLKATVPAPVANYIEKYELYRN